MFRTSLVRVLPWLLCAAALSAAPLPFTGVSLAGGEFGEVKPGQSRYYGKSFIYPNASEVAYFARQGMNTLRVPFRWETLQPTLNGPLDPAQLDLLKESVKHITSKGMVALLDPHNYAKFYDKSVGGPAVPQAAFADFWRKLATEYKSEPLVWFGLVNEPEGLPTKQWFDAAAAAVTAIREAGAPNLILLPGNAYSGAHSWTADWYGGSNASFALNVKDPLNHTVIEVHQYLDSDSSGTKPTIKAVDNGSKAIRAFVAWCREHKQRAFLGEFGVANVPEAPAALADLLDSMERDRDVWIGWAWWAAGPWWGDYMFTLEPKDGVDRPQMAWLKPHCSGVALPQYALTVTGGTGGGAVTAAAKQTITATVPAGKTFVKWTGDTAWLADPAGATATIAMPFRDAQLVAEFR